MFKIKTHVLEMRFQVDRWGPADKGADSRPGERSFSRHIPQRSERQV